jgi:hypothetical protein
LVVSTFQSRNVPIVHYTAALGLFVFATLFTWLEVFISSKLRVFRSWALSQSVFGLRVFFASLQSAGFCGVIAFASIWQTYESGTGVLWFVFFFFFLFGVSVFKTIKGGGISWHCANTLQHCR